MTEAGFQRTNLDWQLQQLSQRIQEWIELQTAAADDIQFPQGSLPPWLLIILFWILVGVTIFWVLWQLWRLIESYWSERQPKNRDGGRSPVPLVSASVSVEELLRRAQQSQQMGNYGMACRMLYLAMVQRLNDTQQLSVHPSLTDGEFLALVQSLAKTRAYQLLITTHEQACFSDAAISAETFRRCQQAYQEITAG